MYTNNNREFAAYAEPTPGGCCLLLYHTTNTKSLLPAALHTQNNTRSLLPTALCMYKTNETEEFAVVEKKRKEQSTIIQYYTSTKITHRKKVAAGAPPRAPDVRSGPVAKSNLLQLRQQATRAEPANERSLLRYAHAP